MTSTSAQRRPSFLSRLLFTAMWTRLREWKGWIIAGAIATVIGSGVLVASIILVRRIVADRPGPDMPVERSSILASAAQVGLTAVVAIATIVYATLTWALARSARDQSRMARQSGTDELRSEIADLRQRLSDLEHARPSAGQESDDRWRLVLSRPSRRR